MKITSLWTLGATKREGPFNVDVQVGSGRPGARATGRTHAAPRVGPHRRPRGPARGRHVRRHLRLPVGHGAGRQPGHHVLRDLHDPVPGHLQQQGAQLPRHQRLVRRERRGHPRSGRRLRRRDRRDHGRGHRAAPRRRARALRGCRHDPQDPAARRHRRGGHADRLQPGARRGPDLLAPGPVGGAADRRLHGVRRGALPRLLVADRGLPGADLRLPAVVGLRRRLRPDPLDHRLQQRRAPRPRPGQLGGRQGRRLDRLPERRPRRRRLASCTAPASR